MANYLQNFTRLKITDTNMFTKQKTRNRAATREGKRGRQPPKQKFLPPKQPSMSTQTSLTLAAVSRSEMVSFSIGDQQRTRRKVHQFGAMSFFF